MSNLPIDYQKIHLLKILPKNISADNNIQELSSVLDDELQKICKIVDNLNLIDKIDVLPEEIVNLLAWQWHVDYYDNTLPLQNKRRLVKESIRVHKTKGTAWAVENVIKSALGDSRIEEWYEYGGEPYHFRLTNITANIAGPKTLEQLMRAIDSAKNVRSTLDEIIFKRENTGIQYIGGVLSQHTKVRANPKYIGDTVNIGVRYIGGVLSQHTKVRANPKYIGDTVNTGVRYIGGVLSQHTKVRANPKYISDTVNTGARYIGGVIGCYKKIRVMPELIKDSYAERVIYIGGVLATYKKIKAMLM